MVASEPLGERDVDCNVDGIVDIDGGGSYSFRFCSNLQNFGVDPALGMTF